MESWVIKILILFMMIFMHIRDDYMNQGIMASMKQKNWWKNNYPDDMYKFDYVPVLILHSFSWTSSIMIVPILYLIINDIYGMSIIIIFIINTLIHTIVDDLKANRGKINLVQDQLIHIMQIVCTWLLLIL